ncbi:hypothetical protein DFH08DRAFT_1037073 [Mycena albidolilacea]|uniref:Uncharacterized protein n=1 Tax=Mycena albidolilacea TaxID=1033008 RepID=A0AAD7EFK0_9AGAR|nr:hypothetical protein DFH08DRAFT_1037073 [Mycena albidolilacea]
MALHGRVRGEVAPASEMRDFSRKLGQNELSYYLPSRAYGLNDMVTRVIFRAPPALVSQFRLQVVWAIIRGRNSLLACKIDMAPGCYDEARFIYTLPPSPKHALEEAGQALTVHEIKTGPEFDADFITGRRKLSPLCLSRMDVARHREVSPGIDEFHGVHSPSHYYRRYLCTCKQHSGIFGRLRSARRTSPDGWLQAAALKIDFMNVQRRAIGAHAFPRIPSQATKQTLIDIKFGGAQTAALLAKCKSERATLQNTVFALCNFAWIRTAENHPELSAPKTLPMLFYTAISLRRHLAPIAPLSSSMLLALGYGNIVLPAFIPSSADSRATFWLRERSAQSQMRKQTQSPLLLGRAQVLNAERARRAALARQDDEADGMLPSSLRAQAQQPPASNGGGVPSVALMGISYLGDLGTTYQPERYPSIEFLDSVGHSRKAKGGILLFTRSAGGCFSMVLEWDAAAFPPGLVEEFWGYFGGVHEFVLGN